ncbi:hypothetical protein [Aquabacterium sp.]|uniref:hypothetical protein n=1 Tax=Aquabacterium sp. TaxID=1872578 RepID=UPI003D6C85BA
MIALSDSTLAPLVDVQDSTAPFVPILFESPEQFRARPNFVDDLHCDVKQLDKIIGNYEFDKAREQQCGLNGCKTKHWHGFVIRFKDGRETNIGQDCGLTQFDVVFKDFVSAYKAAVDRNAKTQYINDLISQKHVLLRQANELTRKSSLHVHDVNELYGLIQKDKPMEKAFGEAVRLKGQINVYQKVSDAGRMAMGKDGRKEHAEVSVTIGTIVGASCVSQAKVIQATLKFKAVLPLQAIDEAQLPTLTDVALKEWGTKMKDMREALREAEQFCEEADRFCSDRNRIAISKLLEALPSKAKTDRAKKIARRIAEGATAPAE